ncbi:DUF5682 family protein [Gordonia sp. 852002-10350_SCH5691597]|uniref:DUF5682 family protein n=1 Tax=Gordonia sp. 852002-10350_SCH5691597 TaxID=1834085 RepID=UPI0007EA7B82|nr:DUF5682 family protein [Gordonia sp. 852002-10350_SCH5691597]OBA66304.1 hypothetical protein A5777_18380 [Gordonia sp. 852002-10350_SCH5691597]
MSAPPSSAPTVDSRALPGTYVLGIRHHGPGSARAVCNELDRLQPDAVLIEGPADASDLIPAVVDPGMSPPVALLGYAADDPSRAAFWPFAEFSPEWQAMRWAVRARVHVAFCDLPTTMVLAHRTESGHTPADPTPEESREPGEDAPGRVRIDPVRTLATAAGYSDPERWWDDVVETRGEAEGFAAIAEAMATLREDDFLRSPDESAPDELHDERREAHMRQVLRATLKRPGVERVAVVCGAWHAPVLSGKLPPAAGDARILKGTNKIRSKLAWVPWTHSRIASASGYGAGVISPGWYHHLFTTSDDVIVRWLIHQARLLRDKDIDVSSAHIIETARLAEALAVMRHRPLPGLAEVTEATHAVMLDGDTGLSDMMYREAVIGERLGSVPDDAPVVPLQADVTATARSARLKIDPVAKELALDLRKPADMAKSLLLHRLLVLGVEWGEPRDVTGMGTFKEGWIVAWRPDYVIDVVMASVWGTTVLGAATAKIVDKATSADTLGEVTEALESALLAELVDAVAPVLTALDERAAVDHDVAHLMQALPALGRAQRYGDVRGTDTASLHLVASSLLTRICVGIPAAISSLNDDAAKALKAHLDATHETVVLLDEQDMGRWIGALRTIADRCDVNGLLVGRATRLLLDGGHIDAADAAGRLQFALSTGATPTSKTQWIDGFLGDGGLLLVHDRDLLVILDEWLSTLGERDFTDVLPLLRRTFGLFDTSVRRNIGNRVASLDRTDGLPASTTTFDPDLAAPAVRVVADILGLR